MLFQYIPLDFIISGLTLRSSQIQLVRLNLNLDMLLCI